MSTSHTSAKDRLGMALARIDKANAADPQTVVVDGSERPSEWVYSQRMSETLQKVCPNASEELRLAAHAQHIERWILPRTEFPMDRKGYLTWRTRLKNHHASRLREIMIVAGYEEECADRAASLVRKERLKVDPQAQTLEDVICLVFLTHYAEAFAAGHPDDKVVSIIQKTWRKMSPAGHQAALKLELPERLAGLVAQAVEGTEA